MEVKPARATRYCRSKLARRDAAAGLRTMSIYTERRFLPYTPAQLFDLVAAVDRYPEFLPWCLAARIRSSQNLRGGPRTTILADLVVGFRVIRERYTSRIA